MSNQLQDVLQKQQEQKKPQAETENIIQLVAFVVGSEEFSVPILSIQEIIKPLEYTRVPGVPDYVLGVFNMRGIVVPLINLRLRFGLQYERPTEDTRYIVIKNQEEERAGFIIDKLTEAVRIKQSDIDPAPDTVSQNENLIYGVGKKDNRLITILSPEELLKRTF
ncbi:MULTISPECIES: chemotaxis protein CheW [Helicobacter]|uniref:Chemotaxis protein CheW n=1 Tax=Helicobacter ibis TaxID=2962633 RepID=A0ABT4VEJ3_9HELI|nr:MULTISPECIES: chemotaxis protein CheW [Helicobacter]MDA3966672.1 chemotaxis protein CheW [Helicobacter sp. WB40]MDA3968560.1 chemotaxis protein CheW [Helicobacter ibis]